MIAAGAGDDLAEDQAHGITVAPTTGMDAGYDAEAQRRQLVDRARAAGVEADTAEGGARERREHRRSSSPAGLDQPHQK